MLVLSRRYNEKLVLPLINTTIQVVSVKPGVVRLGIDAPEKVKVLREEVLRQEGGPDASTRGGLVLTREEKHAAYNRLNSMNLALALLRAQVRAGMTGPAEATIETLEQECAALHTQLEGCAVAPPATSPAAAKPAKPRVALLVEDDTNERELLAGLLRMAGLDVVTAADGGDALDYLYRHGCPDVALIDLMLPRIDGVSTIRTIRQDHAFDAMRIFAMTGYARDTFNLDPAEAGIDRWLSKPLNPQSLLTDLNTVLAG
ncbi:MAG TPA: response regulator [Gemmataceae bacterium]